MKAIMFSRVLLAVVVAVGLSSCAAVPAAGPDSAASSASGADVAVQSSATTTSVAGPADVDATLEATGPKKDTVVSLGTGVFVQAAGTGNGSGYAGEDGVTLNFEQANLREFLRVVFDTILHENYLVDPQVQGVVTLHTARPVREDVVLSIVETVLHSSGAAVVKDEGVFKVVPLAKAAGMSRSPTVGRYSPGGSRGFGIQVVPLQYASALELQKILTGFMPDGSTIQADELRNVLILSGPRYRLDELLATIRTFDVDWVEGMSFGMFKLRYADAESLIEEVMAIINGGGLAQAASSLRLIPIERLNAVLVISHQPSHIAAVQALIKQFDWGAESAAGRRLNVYELENGKAESIAGVLQEVFAELPAPGQQEPAGDDDGLMIGGQSAVTIIPDLDNNAIVVLAGQQDHRAIEAAIQRLDVAPRQVLMEATIAEVTLSDSLGYGVKWFLANGDHELGFGAPVPSRASGEGLAYALFDEANDVRAFFNALASESSVKFLSTPQVMVLDNQTANIRVGDQIPVTTRSSQSTSNPDAPIVTEVQFRDTGTLLTVTPRIKAGGQVALDISLEVSLPGTEPAVGGGGNVSIAQRTINSSVVVQSGQTIVLGGLILENTSEGKSGVPILKNIPLLGSLFSTTSQDVFRTELIVTMSPRVVDNQRDIRQITEEMRQRMINATEYENSTKQDR
jgi:general secretion pathway protein D